MFWCCKRRTGSSANWKESQNKTTTSTSQVNHRTAAQTMNPSKSIETSQDQHNMERIRTTSSSSFNSVRSVQSFYSAKSGDEDFYSVCSENSVKEQPRLENR